MNALALILASMPTPAVATQQAPPIAPIRAKRPVPSPLPVAPVIATGDQRVMIGWEPTILRCGGRPVVAAPVRRPWNNLIWPGYKGVPVSFAFAIDATGRTIGIRRLRDDAPGSADDLAPTLAATRFPAGAPRQDCTIVYTPRVTSIAETPVADLISYTMTPDSGPLPEAGWARIMAAGNCATEPRPQPLLQAFPDFGPIPGTPGVKDWSMVRYDTDAKGRPVAARTLTGTGNAALDAASIKAVRASRYAGGARTGCLYPYWKVPATLPAPPMPAEDTARPANATCPAGRDWTTGPVLRFPENYRRRSIEGWAIMVYDLAPWGEPGNIRVAAAEPSADFGTQAIEVIRGARLPASDRGATGCTDRVIFKIGTPGSATPPF